MICDSKNNQMEMFLNKGKRIFLLMIFLTIILNGTEKAITTTDNPLLVSMT